MTGSVPHIPRRRISGSPSSGVVRQGCMAEAPLTLRDLNRATLARQMLLGRERVKPLRAIERLAGLQAQWPKPPHIGLWSRVLGFKRDDLLDLLRRRQAVRATMMRGTLHVVSARLPGAAAAAATDAHRAACSPCCASGRRASTSTRSSRSRETCLARGPADLRAGARRARERPSEGRPPGDGVHRAPERAARAGSDRATDAWGFPASPQFALAEGWLGEKLRPSEALDDLVLRYLAAFGPATAGRRADVVRPARDQGGPRAPASEARRCLRDERKRELFDLPEAPRPGPGRDRAGASFFPSSTTSCSRTPTAAGSWPTPIESACTCRACAIAPTFLVGRLRGGHVGRRAQRRTRRRLTVEPFEPLTKKAAGRACAAEARTAPESTRFVEVAGRCRSEHQLRLTASLPCAISARRRARRGGRTPAGAACRSGPPVSISLRSCSSDRFDRAGAGDPATRARRRRPCVTVWTFPFTPDTMRRRRT